MPSRINVANHTHLPKLWQALNTLYLHQHLDWQSIEAQLEQENIICLEDNERISALLSLSTRFHQTSWVKLFGVRNDRDAALLWAQLFIPAVERLCIDSAPIDIYTIANWNWYLRLIKSQPDFAFYLNIVTLERDTTQSLPQRERAIHSTRLLNYNDIGTIYDIDQAAFQPPWQLDIQNLTAACEQSTFSRILEIGDQPVGYILATSSDSSCHLSRIAIKPPYAGKGYGSELLSGLIQHCQENGIDRITVNTQETNLASLNLYRKFDFVPTGEKIPVYFSHQA